MFNVSLIQKSQKENVVDFSVRRVKKKTWSTYLTGGSRRKRGRLLSQEGQKENVVDFTLRWVKKSQPNSVKNSVKKCLLPGSTIKDFALQDLSGTNLLLD